MATSDERVHGWPNVTGETSELSLSLVRHDVGFRLQRKLGLIPLKGMGATRRAIVFAAISWLPVVIWALATGRYSDGGSHDPLSSHFGIHVRCLIAIPLLVAAEGIAQRLTPPLMHYFVDSGLVTPDKLPQFKMLIASVVRIRDSRLPWIVIFAAAIGSATAGAVFDRSNNMVWMNPDGSFTLGAWWFILVIRPLFTALLLAWLWRACLVFILLLKLSRFPLSLVPTHPDRLGGLGFVERFAFIFTPVCFAMSAVVSASFAHEVVYQGANAMDFKGLLIAASVLVSVIFLVPFAPLTLLLEKTKRAAILDYGRVVGDHGRLVRRRWILHEEIGTPGILDAPELGPVADVQTMFDAVQHMRAFPVGKIGLAAIVAPAVLPMLCVFAIELPLSTILAKVLKTLI